MSHLISIKSRCSPITNYNLGDGEYFGLLAKFGTHQDVIFLEILMNAFSYLALGNVVHFRNFIKIAEVCKYFLRIAFIHHILPCHNLIILFLQILLKFIALKKFFWSSENEGYKKFKKFSLCDNISRIKSAGVW